MGTQPGPEDHPGPHGPQPAFPRITLGVSPTPLHQLNGLMSAFGHRPELLAKREDLCGIAAGGSRGKLPRAENALARKPRARRRRTYRPIRAHMSQSG